MKRKKQTLLWKIEGERLPATSYLFGTMHVQDARAFTYLPQLEKAFGNVESFAAEFHLEEAAAQTLNSTSQLPANQSLETFFRPKQYQKLRKTLLKTLEFDIHPFRFSNPFLIVNLIAARILASEHQEPLDEHLWNMAEKRGKALYGIETFAEQMAVLEKIPLKDQVKMLRDLGKNIHAYRQHVHHLIKRYEQGDLDGIYKSVKKNSKGLRSILLYRRNEVMAGRIVELVAKTSVFIAIGAGHLGGGKGVIRYLKKSGLKMSPVSLK